MAARSVFTLGIAPLFGSVALAEDVNKTEASLEYVHANPQNDKILPTFSLNGSVIAVHLTSPSTSESRVSLRAMAGHWRGLAISPDSKLLLYCQSDLKDSYIMLVKNFR